MLEAELFFVSFGDEQKGLDCEWHIRLEVHFVLVIVTAVHKLVKFLVLFFSNLFFVPGPNGFKQIDSFSVDRNGEVDEVRILVDYLLEMCDIGEVRVVFSQMENHSSSSLNRILGLGNVELSWTIRNPRVGILALFSGDDFDLICYNEWGVESDTELTDNVGLNLSSWFLEIFNIFFGAALCDGSQIIDELIFWHANAIVLNNNLILFWEYLNFDI